jgi:hypothetical protein
MEYTKRELEAAKELVNKFPIPCYGEWADIIEYFDEWIDKQMEQVKKINKEKYPLNFSEWIEHSGYKNYGCYDYRKNGEIFTRDKLEIKYRAYHKTF